MVPKKNLAITPVAQLTGIIAVLLVAAFVAKILWLAWPLLVIAMLPHAKG